MPWRQWENELILKDERLGEAITRCQQLIEEREANARMSTGFTSVSCCIVIDPAAMFLLGHVAALAVLEKLEKSKPL